MHMTEPLQKLIESKHAIKDEGKWGELLLILLLNEVKSAELIVLSLVFISPIRVRGKLSCKISN